MNYAPIVLFVYNRPWHTEQTLNALMQNDLADQSVLYIYADGPKENADGNTIDKITETRACIKKQQWCKEVVIVERENNLGLADSIINGVTEILDRLDKVIVLEDDIVPSKGFLKYMNEALSLYEKEDSVGCIHAWNYNLDISAYAESTFFLKGADCWGWATWKRSWSLFNADGVFLLESILSKNIQYEFDRRGTHNYEIMLRDQTEGKNDSWAIRWHASLFLQDKYCLQPAKTIVKNIGLDNSGVHCTYTNMIQNPVNFIEVNKIKVKESEWFFKAYTDFSGTNKKDIEFNKWEKSKTFLRNLYRLK